MPKFSKRSLDKLETCHPDLQKLFKEVVKSFDCTVLCGYRGKEEQDKAYRDGNSKVQYPNGKHNRRPSNAVDVAPYPIDWNDKFRFYYFAGFVMGIAKQLGLSIRYGGDWDRDTDLKDNKFDDLVHFELRKP